MSNRHSHPSGQTAATEDRAEIKQTCGNLDKRVTDSAINVKRAAMAEVRNLEETCDSVDIINSASRLVRLGKVNPSKASPLRAVMTSEVVKDDILSKARKL